MMGLTAKSALHLFNFLPVNTTQLKSGPGQIVIRIALLFALILGVEILTTPHSASSAQSPGVRFAVIGDYGLAGPAEQDVANLVKSWNPDFVITTGDNNYETGQASTIDQNIGQYYHDFIYPYIGGYGAGATVNRFFPTLSDHDWGNAYPNPTGDQPYLDYFSLPGNERYYEFVRGPIHFFALDSDGNEPDGNDVGSIQAQWLQARLAAATEPWKIVYFHQAPYTSSLGQEYTVPAMRWPFKQWGATAVIAGHFHAYERLLVDGLPYLINGRGGHPFVTPFGRPFPGSKVQYLDDYGAMLVDASSETIAFEFINRAGVVIDKFAIPTLTDSMHCPAPPAGAGLVARWSAENSGSDYVGSNDGVLAGGVTFAPGKVGQAFSFDAAAADVKVADSTVLLSPFAALSLDAWVYPTAYGSDTVPGSGIYGKTIISSTDNDGFAMRVWNGYLQADLRLTSTDFLHTFNTGPQSQLPLNAWSHVALTYNGSLVTAYLNGQRLASMPATGNIRNTANVGSCICIGNESIGSDCSMQESGFGWPGLIDEMEVTNRALDPSEISAIYNAGTQGQCYGFPSPTPTPTPTPSPTPTPTPCAGGNRLQDPGVEASTGNGPITNPFWKSTSTKFGSSLCSAAVCGNGTNGNAAPRNGTYWAWFGGTDGPETGTLSQTVTIPSGVKATLSFFLRISKVTSPFADTLKVKVDGTTVQTITEPATAESSYTLRSVDLSAYANGAPHTILFQFVAPSTGKTSSFNIDDITLDISCPPAPAAGRIVYNPLEILKRELLSCASGYSFGAQNSWFHRTTFAVCLNEHTS